MLLRDFVLSSRKRLSELYPPQEAASILELLCTHYLQLKAHAWIIDPDLELSGSQLEKALSATSRLAESEPIQQIIGWSEFYGRRFNVNRDTLIPRPETEILCQQAVSCVKNSAKAFEDVRILDLCTGSGCIAWTLACELPGVRVTAVDISEKALAVAASQNPERADKVIKPDFMLCDILSPEAETTLAANAPYDLIVSNPPYILPSEKTQMRGNVLKYEPHIALFVPEDRSQLFNRKISEISSKFIKTDGELIVEINETLPQPSVAVFEHDGWSDIEVISDFFSKPRFVKATRK